MSGISGLELEVEVLRIKVVDSDVAVLASAAVTARQNHKTKPETGFKRDLLTNCSFSVLSGAEFLARNSYTVCKRG